MTRKSEAQLATACIRNSGFSGKSKVSAFNKSQCQTESEMLLNPLLLIHAKRYPASRIKQTNMNKKNLFAFGKEYLLRRQEITDEVLNHYLTLWQFRQPKTFNKLCHNMIDHAQNRQGMPNSIGDTNNLSKILFDFNPEEIKQKYDDWKSLFETIEKSKYTPPGRMQIDNSHNYWVIFTKSIISIANYLSRFKTFDNYKKYVETFISENPDIRLAFPLILKEEIFGYKFALACDFTKENVSPKFIKPDTHIKDIFVGVGLCDKDDNDYNIFRKVVDYCIEINEEPYAVDRLFWLIGSGKLFKTEKRQDEVFFNTNKYEFIKEFIDKQKNASW